MDTMANMTSLQELPTTDDSLMSYAPRDYELFEELSQSELGLRNDKDDIRRFVTNQSLQHVGIMVIGEVRGVDYGTWKGSRACFVQLGYSITRTRVDAVLKSLKLNISFKGGERGLGRLRQHPVVRAVMPGTVHLRAAKQSDDWDYQVIQAVWPIGQFPRSNITHDILNTYHLSVTGEGWPRGGRQEPRSATWTLENLAEDARWTFEGEIIVCTIVEWPGVFFGEVQIEATGSLNPGHFLTFRNSLLSKVRLRDDHLIFNQKTRKGTALLENNFDKLQDSQIPPCILKTRLAKEKPPRDKGTTYRVRGISTEISRDQLRTTIQELCKVDSPEFSVTICSLAANPHRHENVATITFNKTPQLFKDISKEEWFLKDPSSSDPSEGLLFDVHFRGLTPLAAAREPSSSADMFDLIVVSGLGGHAFGSFKERGGPYMWLRDCLPKDLPNTRILLYGHDSHLVGSSSFQSLSALGKQLQASIKSIRNYSKGPSPERPMILIGHSLGGLLIVQALVLMNKGDESDKANFKSTCGIISFGAPNKGMSLESLVAMVQNQPNRYLLETLRPESEVLENLRNGFLECFTFEDSEVISVYETVESPTAQKVGDKWEMTGPPAILVTSESAMLGRRGDKGVSEIGFNKSHSELVKFRRHEEEYEWIKTRLQGIVKRAAVVIPLRFAEQRQQHESLSSA